MTIRTATPADLPAVKRLLGDAHAHAARSLETIPDAGFWMVLDDASGGLAAAMLVTIDDDRGHRRCRLALLALAAHHHGDGLEARMVGVAEALCRAFGCDTLDVRGHRAA